MSKVGQLSERPYQPYESTMSDSLPSGLSETSLAAITALLRDAITVLRKAGEDDVNAAECTSLVKRIEGAFARHGVDLD